MTTEAAGCPLRICRATGEIVPERSARGPNAAGASRALIVCVSGLVLSRAECGNQQARRMIVTTTDTVEGRRITCYHGVVSGETVVGTNIFKDIVAGITDIVGGRSGGYEKELCKAKDMAIDEMVEEARSLGAHAVVDLDYEHIGGGSRSMLIVIANGTAVNLD